MCYQGIEGKYYGLEDSLFASSPLPKKQTTAASIKLEVPTDDSDMYMTVYTAGSEREDRTGANELYKGHDAHNDVYITMPNGAKYLFQLFISDEPTAMYIYRCNKPYTDHIEATVFNVSFSDTAEVGKDDVTVTLEKVSDTEFTKILTDTSLISTAFTKVV